MGIIHFLNVNEGDCTWIHHASGRNTIIDVSAAAAITEFASASGNHQQKNYPVNPIQYLKRFRCLYNFPLYTNTPRYGSYGRHEIIV